MKRNQMTVSLIGLAALFIATASCATLTACATSQHRTWRFMQSVGGIKVGEAQAASGKTWNIPVECDVSGLTTITTKPAIMNSALAVKDVKVEVKQDQIMIWVVTCAVNGQCRAARWNKGVELGGVEPGHYRVQYLNPDGSTVEIRSMELRQ